MKSWGAELIAYRIGFTGVCDREPEHYAIF